MIVECKTVEEIEDVATTYGIKLYDSLPILFDIYKEVCINTDTKEIGLTYRFKSEGKQITPYADWKLLKQIENGQSIKLNEIELRQIDYYYAIYIDYKMIEYGLYMSPIELFNKIKHYEEMEKMNDQFIQLEGGKLNITKAKRLGLWKEDKKVFTVDKDCDIKCGEYRIQSYEVQSCRVVDIFANGRTAVRLFNPTLDKVRHEFAYYGIDVDVI